MSKSSHRRELNWLNWLLLGLFGCVGTLAGCDGTSIPVEQSAPFGDGEGVAVAVPEATAPDTSLPPRALSPVEQLDGYSLIADYVETLVLNSPGLQKAVSSTDDLDTCMVERGYQINQLPIYTSGDVTVTTFVPPERLLSPMLNYLVESCTGVPMSQWQRNSE